MSTQALDFKPMTELSYTSDTKVWLGEVAYLEGEAIQDQMVKRIGDEASLSPGVVLGLEHPDCVTLGRSAKASEEFRSPGKIELYLTGRGGKATIHSRGQLVIYPIINLRSLGWGVRDYVECLVGTSEYVLRELGLETKRRPSQTGVFTARGKIGFVGVQIKNGISRHGVSINNHNDLSLFQLIRSCGVENETFDRISDYGLNYENKYLFDQWVKKFFSHLGQ